MNDQKKFDVICIGQVVQDILITNVPVNAFGLAADTVKADSLTLTSGGDAANEAVVLSRLGNRSALLTRLDNRNVGDMIYDDMVAEKVDVSLVTRLDDCETFTSIVLIHPNGEHNFIVGPGKNYTPEMRDIRIEDFKNTRAVAAASLFSLGELDTNGIERIFMTAQEAGALTIADMNYDLKSIGPHGVDHVFAYTDYLMPSLNEAIYATGLKDLDEIADYFLDAGVRHVVLKLGAEGSFFKSREERFFMDAYDVTPVDTTGCGDNYVAAFIHGLLKGWKNRECAEFASAAGALNSMGIGAHMYIESEQQIFDFMAKAKKRELHRS